VQVLDAPQVVAKLGLSDLSDQRRWIGRLVPVHLILRPAARRLQNPGALACSVAHRGEHIVRG
jgi:hypothetical protein